MINYIVEIIAAKEITPAVKVYILDILLVHVWDAQNIWDKLDLNKLYGIKAKNIQDTYNISKSMSHKIFFFLRKMVFNEKSETPVYHTRKIKKRIKRE